MKLIYSNYKDILPNTFLLSNIVKNYVNNTWKNYTPGIKFYSAIEVNNIDRIFKVYAIDTRNLKEYIEKGFYDCRSTKTQTINQMESIVYNHYIQTETEFYVIQQPNNIRIRLYIAPKTLDLTTIKNLTTSTTGLYKGQGCKWLGPKFYFEKEI